jgi:hypothetical protein
MSLARTARAQVTISGPPDDTQARISGITRDGRAIEATLPPPRRRSSGGGAGGAGAGDALIGRVLRDGWIVVGRRPADLYYMRRCDGPRRVGAREGTLDEVRAGLPDGAER